MLAKHQNQPADQLTKAPSKLDSQAKYKTELCRNWLNGHCTFGVKCTFAHGASDIRPKLHLPAISPSPQPIKRRLPVFQALTSDEN